MIGQRAELVASRQPGADEMAAYERVLSDALEGDADAVCADGLRRRGVAHRRSGVDDEDAGSRIRAGDLGSRRCCAGHRTSRRVGEPGDTEREWRLMPDAGRKSPTTNPLSSSDWRHAREWDAPWRRWGPYLSERQWGTVREDYSEDGERVGVLPPRPRAVARVPLGRGRARGLLRPEAATVFRAGALEREGPDSEGAALRLEQCARGTTART